MKLFCLALALLACSALAAPLPDDPEETLTGVKVTLAKDVVGRGAVLVLGFTRNSGPQTRAWREALTRADDGGAGPLVYEAPVMEGLPGFLRGFVLGRLRTAVGAGAPRVLPLFHQAKAWQALAKYEKGDGAHVLVVDPAGEVVRVLTGAPDEASVSQALLEATRSAPR